MGPSYWQIRHWETNLPGSGRVGRHLEGLSPSSVGQHEATSDQYTPQPYVFLDIGKPTGLGSEGQHNCLQHLVNVPSVQIGNKPPFN